MERLLIVLALVAMGACALSTAVLQPTIDKAATAVIEEQMQTDPMESLMAYDGVPEQHTSPIIWIAMGVLPFVLIGGVLIYMSRATEWSKERRRASRAARGGHQMPLPPYAQQPMLPPQAPYIPLPPPSQGERRW